MATHGYESGRLNLPCLTPDAGKRQYVFTEWDPTATSDMEALASVFDSNGDGVLDASDSEFADFKVLVSNAVPKMMAA